MTVSDKVVSALNTVNPDPSKAGGTLLALNAIGMVFAALSNTFAAAIDKNTSNEDKKILVPAGFATGAANIAIYYGMTTKIIDKLAGKKCVINEAKGKTTAYFIKKHKLKEGMYEIIKGEDGKDKFVDIKGLADRAVESMEQKGTLTDNAKEYATKAIDKAKNGVFGFGKKSKEYIDDMSKTLLKDGVPTDKAKEMFKSDVKAGMGVLGAFAGAVIGCAILTPIIRDVMAYVVQKKMEKKNPEMQNQPYGPYFDPTHLKVNVKGKNQALNMKNYMAFTRSHSGLKI